MPWERECAYKLVLTVCWLDIFYKAHTAFQCACMQTTCVFTYAPYDIDWLHLWNLLLTNDGTKRTIRIGRHLCACEVNVVLTEILEKNHVCERNCSWFDVRQGTDAAGWLEWEKVLCAQVEFKHLCDNCFCNRGENVISSIWIRMAAYLILGLNEDRKCRTSQHASHHFLLKERTRVWQDFILPDCGICGTGQIFLVRFCLRSCLWHLLMPKS